MSSAANHSPIQVERILVALDASADSVAALQAAAELAAALEAELLGLYVEDIELVHLSSLPFAVEIDVLSGERRRLEARVLERQLRVQAARARRSLEEAARPLGVRWSFRCVRGRVATELLAVASEVDMVSLGIRSQSLRRGLGSTARVLLEAAPGPVMILRQGTRLGPIIHVLYDGGASSRAALAVAARLAGAARRRLVVVLLEGRAKEAERRVEVESRLEGRSLETEFVSLTAAKTDVSELAALLRAQRSGLLVAPASLLATGPRRLERLVWGIECPVLLVGHGAAAGSPRRQAEGS